MRKALVWIVFGVMLAGSGGITVARGSERPRDLIHAYRVWKLTEVLDLSDEQMPVFFSRLQQVDDSEADLIEDERRLVHRMVEMLKKEDTADADLEQTLARHADIRRERLEDVGRLREDALAVLNVRQRAEYVVFEHRFRSDLRKMIERAKEFRQERRPEERRGMWGDEPSGPGDFDSPGSGRVQRARSGRGGR